MLIHPSGQKFWINAIKSALNHYRIQYITRLNQQAHGFKSQRWIFGPLLVKVATFREDIFELHMNVPLCFPMNLIFPFVVSDALAVPLLSCESFFFLFIGFSLHWQRLSQQATLISSNVHFEIMQLFLAALAALCLPLLFSQSVNTINIIVMLNSDL